MEPKLRCRIVERRGSHFLIEANARYAVVERRYREFYNLQGRERGGFPATPQGMKDAAAGDWLDESTARCRFDEILARGSELAQRTH
jgi:hypothetical protein